jgi:hypothetical protein
MKRSPKTITSDCHTCRRPDWTRKIDYSLETEEEAGKKFVVEGAPSNAELVRAHLGAEASTAIVEAIGIAKVVRRPVAFFFNCTLVVVYRDSKPEDVYSSWYTARYGKTPEAAFEEEH